MDVFLSSLVGINYVEPKSYCSFIITVDKQYECNICDFKTYYLNWRLKNSLILGEMWRICCHQNQKYNHLLMKWQDCSCLPLEVYQKRNTYHIYRIKFKKKIRTPNRNFKPNRWSIFLNDCNNIPIKNLTRWLETLVFSYITCLQPKRHFQTSFNKVGCKYFSLQQDVLRYVRIKLNFKYNV